MTYKSRTEEEEILNHLLIDIVTANSGTIFSNDRISLLESWLDALTINSALVIKFSDNSIFKFSDGSTLAFGA
jgi:hypothetical protein